ncbi:uncharacterized protein LOC134821935 isoform X2 [Bolinopsis microptera]|uniref:uncharacterized protein LOC134821935 isoform X2 n=1 Tax=Bolinopsis microptera TaxID=2820187 RepID=UPI003079FBA5
MMLQNRMVVLVLSVLSSLILLFWIGFDSLVSGGTYTYQIFRMMSWDESRIVDLKLKLLADDEWKLHKLNMKYYKNECTDEHNNPRYAWISALNNDKYVLPTLVLGHLLNNLSCIRNKVVLVSHKVSRMGILALESVGFQVIYLDSDYFPTTPLDSLFEQVEANKLTAAYCSKPGVVDPCFNAGLVGMVPDPLIYQEVMEHWKQLSATSCPDDQRLLWYHFSNNDNWIPLSYSYNVRRERYFPMKSFHFAGHGREPRPWDWKDRPSDAELLAYDRQMDSVMDIISLWWKYLLVVVRDNELNEFWESVKYLTL